MQHKSLFRNHISLQLPYHARRKQALILLDVKKSSGAKS